MWCEGIGIFYACTDEIHQLFVPDRSGQLTDVLIDSIGLTLGLLFFLMMLKFRRRNSLRKLFKTAESIPDPDDQRGSETTNTIQ